MTSALAIIATTFVLLVGGEQAVPTTQGAIMITQEQLNAVYQAGVKDAMDKLDSNGCVRGGM